MSEFVGEAVFTNLLAGGLAGVGGVAYAGVEGCADGDEEGRG